MRGKREDESTQVTQMRCPPVGVKLAILAMILQGL